MKNKKSLWLIGVVGMVASTFVIVVAYKASDPRQPDTTDIEKKAVATVPAVSIPPQAQAPATSAAAVAQPVGSTTQTFNIQELRAHFPLNQPSLTIWLSAEIVLIPPRVRLCLG